MRHALVISLCLIAVPAIAETVLFELSMDGPTANQCQGTDSPATGTGTFVLDTATGRVSYDIQYTDNLLAPETVAHIHGPAPECENAPPVVDLELGLRKRGEATLTPAQARAMLDGLLYVNVHSEANPGGEIRGQILAVREISPAPVGTPWALGLAIAALLASGVWFLRRS